MDIDKSKYELRLLKGLPITMENGIMIHPVTANDVLEIEEINYQKYLNFLTLDKSSINELMSAMPEMAKLLEDTFQFLVLYCATGDEFRELIEKAISFFVKEDVKFIAKTEMFIVGDIKDTENLKFLNDVNYKEFKTLLKLQNASYSEEETGFNPKNDKAKKIKEKLEKAKAVVNKIKKNDDENSPLNLSDLISILSANGNNLNIYNVWDLTIYQINDQFNRMKMMENFNISIQQLLAGVDPNKIELKHWMQKIK